MKRFTAILLAQVLGLGLAACSNQGTSPSWEEQYEQGTGLLSEEKYDEAIDAFTAAIEVDPAHPEVYTARGDAYRQLGKLEEATQDYEKALELNANDGDTAVKLADILVEQGKIEEAAGILENLVQQYPDNTTYSEKLNEIRQTAGTLPPIPDDGIQREVVEITNGDELTELVEQSYTESLRNLEIHLGDGDYNVNSLFLMNAENVSFIGTGKTRLVSTSGIETIISMYNCDNVLLYGLVMGHDLDPIESCSTGVVELLSSKNMKIVGCDIYGCGLQGISADSSSFTVDSSTIRDCSQHGVLIYASQGTFDNCTFSGNCYQYSSNPVFRITDAASAVTLNNCSILDNPAQAKYLLASGASDWTENNTIERGNAWQ